MNTRIRWMPFENPVSNYRTRLFNELWKPFPFEEEDNSPATPAMDVIDYEDRLEVQVNLPGISPENVGIEFEKGVLTIAAEAPHSEEQVNYTRRERYHGAYRRSVRVSDSLDVNAAAAQFENGVLTLTLPKKPESQPLRIKVNGQAIEA